MPLSFPSSPSVGQQSVQNGRTYSWDGYAWTLVANVSTHASTHATGGSDAITPASISAAPAANPTFTGVVTVAAGSVSAPSLTFSGDVNTGVYTPGADQIAVTCGGVQRLLVGSAGGVGINVANITGYSLRCAKTITGATTAYGYTQEGTVASDVTAGVTGYISQSNTAAAAFTLGAYTHFSAAQGTIGANSAVTTQTGFSVSAGMTGATNNYGFRGLLASASGRWNVYCDGTAQNWLRGNLGIGANSSAPTSPLDVDGDNIRVRTAKTPLSATDTGAAGQVCWDANYVYICVATNSWKRAALAAW